MIPTIRSISELMALTVFRDRKNKISIKEKNNSLSKIGTQRFKLAKSINSKTVELPYLPKSIKNKWIKKKEHISKFIDELDYNNQIQSSYDLTLQETQNKVFYKDIA